MTKKGAAQQALHITLLGGFRIASTVSGQGVLEDRAWRLRKAAALVKLLCLSPSHRLQRDQLLDTLWPDLDPKAAANNLHYVLHFARRTLESAFPFAGRSLHVRGGVVELHPECQLTVDVEQFEAAVAAALTSAEPAAHAAAIQLYAGDLLPDDPYEDWTVARREYLRERYQTLLRQKGHLHAQRGEHAAAVEALTLALASEPASEEAHAALMRLYALAGQRDQALRQFQQLREALRRELDAEPDPTTHRLYEDILSGRLADAGQQPPAASWPHSTTASRKHNLPYAITSFVGRRRELTELPDVVAQHRLVTLAGTGGCGKTRLALEVAHSLVDRFADGVWLVELAPLADGHLIPQATAAALGIVEEPSHPLLEALCRQLAERQLIIVLDNCEHVGSDAAAFADALLRAAPNLRILATSREPLGIVGEVVRRVPSLALPDPEDDEESEAVRLFVDRARRVQPAFRLGARRAPTVARICRRVDGIPLAIELAAARVDALSAMQIAERLDDCFRLLTSGGRTTVPRHQTLRAAVDWSYVLLAAPERTLFNRLSVFGGPFTLDAAEHVCRDDATADVLTHLAQLVNKSLVMLAADGTESGLRYRLLEPLRQYAAERLREASDAQTHRRHAAYFAALAERGEDGLAGPDQLDWLDRLQADHDNLRAALRWSFAAPDAAGALLGLRTAAALARFWQVRSHLDEGHRALETAIARCADLPQLETALRARLLDGAGGIATLRADYDRAATLHDEALRLRRAAGDARGTGWSLLGLADVAHARGDYYAAQALYEEALDHLRAAADQRGIATAYGSLGYVAGNLGNHGYAEGLCRQSLRVYEELGDRRCVALSLAALGHVARGCADHAASAAYYAQSLQLAHALGARRDIAGALEGLATALGATDRAEEAAVLFSGAGALRRASGAPRPDADRPEYDRSLCALRTALGEEGFCAASERGAALSPESLVDFALTAQPPIIPSAPQTPLAQALQLRPS